MSAAVKPVAKSLHTVTVIVQVARLHQRLNNETRDSAVTSAMIALGLHDRPDPYGLRDAALKQLQA